MLDFDLAALYEVETRRLKEQVRRNIERFPGDFMFQLTKKEWCELIAICDKLPDNIKHSPIALRPAGFVIRPAGFAIPQLQVSGFAIHFFALQMQILTTAGLQIRQDGLPDLARTRPGADLQSVPIHAVTCTGIFISFFCIFQKKRFTLRRYKISSFNSLMKKLHLTVESAFIQF
jgi:hypothetical protein